jgi:hypothetical protein
MPKSWKTLPDFHRLLIEPQGTNGLDVTEFCASATLLKTEQDSTTMRRNKIPKVRRKTETPEFSNTIPLVNSPLSDGSLFDSKRSAAYELRLSEIGPD